MVKNPNYGYSYESIQLHIKQCHLSKMMSQYFFFAVLAKNAVCFLNLKAKTNFKFRI